MKKMSIETNVYDIQDVFDNKVKKGDYIEYQNELYTFDGYDYGTYPIVTNVKTGEQRELPHI